MSLVLLVDDDPAFRKLAHHILSKRKWNVEAVESADAAIEFLSRSQPDILITDIQMPGQDGLALTAHTVLHFPQIPVLVLTGADDQKTAVASFRIGAADYVQKENVQSELVTCVAKLLHEEAMIEKSANGSIDDSAGQASTETPATLTPDTSSIFRQEIERDYVVRKWGDNVISAKSSKAPDREICEQRMRVLRRQVERLDKWSTVSNECLNKRQNTRHFFADVVHMIPLNSSGQPEIGGRFACFCRNISSTGCSIIRNGLLREKTWGIFFPHRGPIASQPICLVAEMVRDRPIPLGMYEMGFIFKETIELSPEDAIVMLPKRQAPNSARGFASHSV